MNKVRRSYWLILAAANIVACSSPVKNTKETGSPLDNLPPYITQITYFGERADWSHDGKKILFLEKTFGDVYEVTLETGDIQLLTRHYFHEGYTRALYLSNGDILLSGSATFDATNPWASRGEEKAELWILKKDLQSPAVALGAHCSEGPAVSRKNMKIAWTLGNAFYMAEIADSAGIPVLKNKKKILDGQDLPFRCYLETQNFRPPDENELIFSAYEYQGSEVMGLNIETGEIINYSNAPDQYDEPEGIFPDGSYTLTECDKHKPEGIQVIDIYKLALDQSGISERLTFFSDYPGYKASNPVVSDDGKFMAFQVARLGDQAGVGRGILVFDIEKFNKLNKGD